MNITLDFLKNNHQLIHYFGLGFIQIKLNDRERVHFYTKKLPAIINLEDIHDHRYDFKSTILKGKLKHETFQIIEGETHTMRKESCKKGTLTESISRTISIEPTGSHCYVEGSEYFIQHNVLHRVFSDNCITYIERSDYKKEEANVVQQIGKEKICPFSKEVSKEELWKIVEDMLNENS